MSRILGACHPILKGLLVRKVLRITNLYSFLSLVNLAERFIDLMRQQGYIMRRYFCAR